MALEPHWQTLVVSEINHDLLRSFTPIHLASPSQGGLFPIMLKWEIFSGSKISPKYGAGIGKNHKYVDGIRNLTARREAGLAKIWAWDVGFFRLFAGYSGNYHHPNERSSGQSRWCLLPNQTIECAWLVVI